MNNEYSTGNQIVDELGKMNISGNIIPIVWFQTIRYQNGKPNVNAIIILADIVYWYRPTEIRDEMTGQIIGMRKKFRDDLLQRNYRQIGDQFGLTKKQVVTAINALQDIGVIRKDFRNLKVGGQSINNVLYLELVPERLLEITYPEKTQILPISTSKATGISLEDHRYATSKGTGVALEEKTNTKTSTENITRDYNNQINLSGLDMMDLIDTYTKIIKENIAYDILVNDRSLGEKRYIDEMVELIVELVAVEQKTVRIAGTVLPYRLVKGKLLKLNDSHIRYVLECLEKNTTKIRNIKKYLLTALYNAPNTIDSYYRAEVNHDLYGI